MQNNKKISHLVSAGPYIIFNFHNNLDLTVPNHVRKAVKCGFFILILTKHRWNRIPKKHTNYKTTCVQLRKMQSTYTVKHLDISTSFVYIFCPSFELLKVPYVEFRHFFIPVNVTSWTW